MNIFWVIVTLFCAVVIIFHIIREIKNQFTKEAILSERVRTLLLLSRHLQKPISVLLNPRDKTIDHAVVKTGVVSSVIFGESAKGMEPHRLYIGGKFSFLGEDVFYDIKNIFAISFDLSTYDPTTFLSHPCTLNTIQHLSALTGLQSDSNTNETHYYRILGDLFLTIKHE